MFNDCMMNNDTCDAPPLQIAFNPAVAAAIISLLWLPLAHADGPTAGLKAVVKAHDRALSNTLSEQLDYEKETQRMLFDFPHVSEGIRAFIEKREPIFRDVS